MADARRRTRTIVLALAGAALACAAGSARAQDADDARAMRLIVPAPTGGSASKVGALVATQLGSILGRPIVVEHRPGGGMVSGFNAIASAPPDGDTLGLAISTAMIGGRLLSRGARYNPTEDFTWLAILGSYANAMVIPERDPARTLAQWLEAKRASPRPLVAGVFAPGSAGHLAASFLRVEQGVPLQPRFLESPAEGYGMLASGQIDVLFDGMPNAVVELPKTRHRAIAVTSARPVPAWPDVPAFGATWPGMQFDIWFGLVAPRGLPEFARARLAAAVGVLLLEPVHAAEMRATGLRYLGIGGDGALAFVEDDVLRTARLISRLGEPASK